MSNNLFTTDATGATRPATADEILDAARAILAHRVRRGAPVSNPRHTREFLRLKLGALEHEVFAMIALDNRHRIIEYVELFRGTVDGASVHPREVVKEALRLNAAALILVHNHPSGVAEPSQADELITAPPARRPGAGRHSRPRPPRHHRRRRRQLRGTRPPLTQVTRSPAR